MGGVQTLQILLMELVYADGICLLASPPEQLQATYHMKISVPQTKVIVSAVLAPCETVMCNGNFVQQVHHQVPWA